MFQVPVQSENYSYRKATVGGHRDCSSCGNQARGARDVACEPIEELPRLHENPALVPHYLPGKNPFLNEVTQRYNIPLEAVLGGPETMYPQNPARS